MIVSTITSQKPTGKREIINVDSDSETEDSDDEIEVIEPNVGWAYLGSHNFTPSAWGNLSGSAFNPVMNVRNELWEPKANWTQI